MTDKGSSKGLGSCHSIVLAGGAGTRLWPMSLNLLPKQLLTLDGYETLLQRTVSRLTRCFEPAYTWLVTNDEHVFEVRAQVRAIVPELEFQVLAEPFRRDALPAILLALDKILASDDDALCAVFPSDHLVKDEEAWQQALVRGIELTLEGYFVTFSVLGDNPET